MPHLRLGICSVWASTGTAVGHAHGRCLGCRSGGAPSSPSLRRIAKWQLLVVCAGKWELISTLAAVHCEPQANPRLRGMDQWLRLKAELIQLSQNSDLIQKGFLGWAVTER